MIQQQTHPKIAADRVQAFAPHESVICFEWPPFRTVAEERAAGATAFWDEMAALHQIVPEQALIIADFGLGSDSPVILDYSQSASDPTVRYLHLKADNRGEWIQGARDFDDFAMMLGLTEPV